MNGILLISKKTYSLSKKVPITKWIEKPYEIDNLKMPKDFELRFVNANLEMKGLSQAFPEFELSWNTKYNIRDIAKKECTTQNGLTDIVWYSEKMQLIFIIDSHKRLPEIMHVQSEDEIKRILGGNDDIRQN